MDKFNPTIKLTSDGIEYEFIRDYTVNKKGDKLSEKCYLYRQLNKIDKGKEQPFVKSQIQWMIDNPNYSSQK
jgi:hypothetical protein